MQTRQYVQPACALSGVAKITHAPVTIERNHAGRGWYIQQIIVSAKISRTNDSIFSKGSVAVRDHQTRSKCARRQIELRSIKMYLIDVPERYCSQYTMDASWSVDINRTGTPILALAQFAICSRPMVGC
jgi:hypothetical protein